MANAFKAGFHLIAHLVRPIPVRRAMIIMASASGTLVPAKKLVHLGLQGSVHQKLDTKPSSLLQDLSAADPGKRPIDMASDKIGGQYPDGHWPGSFLEDLLVLRRNLHPSQLYRLWTPDTEQIGYS
jgi:hypothetical protein